MAQLPSPSPEALLCQCETTKDGLFSRCLIQKEPLLIPVFTNNSGNLKVAEKSIRKRGILNNKLLETRRQGRYSSVCDVMSKFKMPCLILDTSEAISALDIKRAIANGEFTPTDDNRQDYDVI